MENHKASRRRPSRFDLIAGNVSLDFVNTLDDRHIQPKELLEHYDDLARFGEDAGLLTPSRVDQLVARSSKDPDRAEEALRRARELREAIHDVFWALINHRSVPAEALATLNDDARIAAEHLRLVPINGGFEWRFDDLDNFDSLLWQIARAAADLLASDQIPFVRACSAKDCEWFFLDTSKNHHRRWCDMKRCGNRAKVRKFYAKKKTT
ncbi:MAG: CGNR zinc finger domain-containing protein [Candidatus Sulfotelmatobacter sp.]